MISKSLVALCAASMLIRCEAQSETAVVPPQYAKSTDGEVQVFAANAGDDRRRVVQALVKAIADNQEASRFRVTWSTGEGEEKKKKKWGSDSRGNVVYDRQRKALKLWSRDYGIMSQFEGHYSGVTDEVLRNLASSLEKFIVDPDQPPDNSFYLTGLVEHGAQQTTFETFAFIGKSNDVAEKYRKSPDGVVQARAANSIFERNRVVITLADAVAANPNSQQFRVDWGYGAAGTSTDGALLYDRDKSTIKYWLKDIGLYGIGESKVLYTNVNADMIQKVGRALRQDRNEKLPTMLDFQVGQLTTLGAKRTVILSTDKLYSK